MRRLVPISIAVVLMLSGCGGSGAPADIVTATPPGTTTADEGAPTATLEHLLGLITDPHGEYQTQDFVTEEHVTADFRAAFDQEFADGQLDFDPFICAQQIPLKIDYVKESIEGSEARVTASVEYGGDSSQLQVYDMVDEDGAWKLDRTECLG